MSDLDWNWLKSQCLSFHASKLNDIERIKISHEIRQDAYSKGFTPELVSKAMHLTGKIYRGGQEKPKVEDKPKDPIQEPPAQTGVDLSIKAPMLPLDPVAPSGVRGSGKYKGPSILDLIDNKRVEK